jgi:dTDP-4-dehydrorhamnose reductase
MKKRLLITGGSGLLAVNCAIQLRARYDITLALHTRHLSVSGVRARACDLSSFEAARKVLLAEAPDLVIHTAAATNVEQCEADPGMATRINVQLARDMASACAEAGCAFVHISTDHLFGDGGAMNCEDTPVSPVNIYGATKAEAETAVLAAYPRSLVIRTNFYGWGLPWRQSFSDGIVNGLRSGRSVSLFDDVYFTPIIAECLIETIAALAEGNHKGCFNIGSADRLSKYEFGVRLAKIFGLDSSLIRATKIADFPNLVTRPREMSLDISRVQKLLGCRIGGVDKHLRLLLEQEAAGIRNELGRVDASAIRGKR